MKKSPYTPGAGHSPKVLAGRTILLDSWREMLSDLSDAGRVRAADTVLTGPRGVGKTSTMSEFRKIAGTQKFDSISLQSVSGTGSLIDGLMRHADAQIRAHNTPWERAKSVLERIGGVALGVGPASAGVTFRPPATGYPPVDPSSFARALAELAQEIHAATHTGGLLITVDELQVTDATDLALLAATLGRLNDDHPEARIAFAATGLPNTYDALVAAGVTHPDRLFDDRPIPLELDPIAARYAVSEPAHLNDVLWQPNALDHLVDSANRYPAHLQLMAHRTWLQAAGPAMITEADAATGVRIANVEIERRTLIPRWNRLKDRQAEMLAAIAVNGGTVTSKQLAQTLARPQNEWSATRAELIASGDVYPPKRARLTVTVPALTPYVLANYEERRDDADLTLLTLDELKKNATLSTDLDTGISS